MGPPLFNELKKKFFFKQMDLGYKGLAQILPLVLIIPLLRDP